MRRRVVATAVLTLGLAAGCLRIPDNIRAELQAQPPGQNHYVPGGAPTAVAPPALPTTPPVTGPESAAPVSSPAPTTEATAPASAAPALAPAPTSGSTP